jgi:UDP-GlcNAc:undecaprenyl-phosphate/decaprenyl-phosphate GlcNAc-1-phosphate transferase
VKWAFAVMRRGATCAGATRRLFEYLEPASSRRVNYRQRDVSLAAGPALAVTVLAAVATDRALDRRVRGGALLAGGVAAVAGAIDDRWGTTHARGLHGHLGALRRGQLTTGMMKMGSIGVAGLAAGWRVAEGSAWCRLAAGGVVASSANLVNLLDLRPGRALKAALVMAAPVAARDVPGRRVAAAAGGAAAGLLPVDLGERAMLGDTGANCLGALLGVALIAGGSKRRIVTSLAVLAALTAASEAVSFSAVIDKTPPLRWFDRLGRVRTDG